MAYVQPQLRIFQLFEAVLATGITPLYSCIIGPQYGLHRFGVTDEEASLGSYDNTGSNAYSYADKSAGSTVETSSAKLYFKDAILKYYGPTGSSFAVPTGTAAGQNKIRAPSLILKTTTNGATTYTRSAAFGTRDVAVGDYVKVSWTGASTGTVETQVMDFLAEQLASVGAATAFSGNQAATTAIPAAVDSSTTVYPFVITAAGTYDGLASGHVNETYTITCTKAGASGTAEVSIVSTSGTDDVANKVVTFASTDIGTRGVTMTLVPGTANESSSSSSNSSDIPPEDRILNVGDSIVISAQMTYAKPTPVKGGTFSGPSNTQYIVQIVQGGVVDTDTITFKVTTSNGVDIQAETPVTAAGAAIIGNYGVTLTFTTADQFCGGDIWTMDCISDTNGAVRTIILADKLVDGANSCIEGDILTVTLGLTDTIQLGATFYTLTSNLVTVLGSATYTGTYLGTAQVFPILSADMYIEYRELLIDNVASAGSITDSTAVASALGPVDVLNPLAKGVYSAALNSAGVTVYYLAVESDDLAGYTRALEILTTNNLVYSLVPLNKDTAVKELFEGHVDAQSSPDQNNWRICWLNSSAVEFQSIYTTESSEVIYATITDDLSGTNYVNVLGTDTLFVTRGVQAGDILRYSYRPVNGVTVYNSVAIDSVDTETALTLVEPVDANYPTEIKIEIWRTRTNSQFASAIASESAAILNRRVRNIWPDVIEDANTQSVSGVYLCAALAGLRSGVAPHQPLTNVSISGFYSPARSTMFSNTQLNTIAAGGTWIVTEDLAGTVYTRHQLTTDMTDINRREDTITTNLDSISRIVRDNFTDVIGKGNVSPDMISLIRIRIHSTAAYIMGLPYPLVLGPQMQGYEILTLKVDPLLRDRIILKVQPLLPYPLNNLDITMYIS
jgi:hypothetical protein